MVSEGARPWGRGRSGDCDIKRSMRFCGGAVEIAAATLSTKISYFGI